jgi:CheY-like chemotaxis protein
VSASDGRRAIQLLESERPDVVMADVDLPDVDGYALAAHMRRIPRLRDVPLLLLAGAFEPVDQDRAREVGSDGVIMKPFEPQVVVSRVKELIDQRLRQSAPPPGASGSPASGNSTSPEAPAPPVAGPFSRAEPAFPRMAPREDHAPSADGAPVVPEPLELPTRPMWDASGSVAAPSAPASMPFPPSVAAVPAAPVPMPLPPVMPPPATPAPKVTLASAFTALLAAEQSSQPSAPAITEATIEDAVRRVLVRMTDDLVRRIVLETAERLIREEIEKIKATPD